METDSTLSGVQPAITISEAEAELISSVTRAQAEASPFAGEWSLTRRLSFRLAFTYLVLYALPFPLGCLPGTATLGSYYETIWHLFVPWVWAASTARDLPNQFRADWQRRYHLQLGAESDYAVLAIVGSAIWSVLDRKRLNYDRLHNWLRLYVRLYAGAIAISHGAYKVIQSQFPAQTWAGLCSRMASHLRWAYCGRSWALHIPTISLPAPLRLWEERC